MSPGETMSDLEERFNLVVLELIILGKEYTNKELALNVMRALRTERADEICVDGFSSSNLAGTNSGEEAAAATAGGGGGGSLRERGAATLAIRSTTIGKSRVAIDPIAMHTSWRSNSDIASVTSIGYPRMSASGESSTTMHRLPHASGSHPIPTPYDPKTNQYNQDLGDIHSTNGNHLESPNEGSSIDHQVTTYLHAQNITMFPTNETWYFASQILVSNSGGLILMLTAQSTRNMFRIHSDFSALNEMIHEYKKLSQSFEEVKSEKESRATKAELVSSENLQTALSKLMTENEELRSMSQDMIENQRLAEIISFWTKSSPSLQKLQGAMKSSGDIRIGLWKR
ncbi:hypothetical protein F511_36176 [Dorcoceras hygrometricum]|uniref:Uncharacterized protein n=1 Tax=Dorcoceras hygrometricum TaxID=472368 RepID=A0A2Z7B5F4_9LAMI|nr:hypothetical protein F511_36176 [Dorcoceras hygrometricum]